MPIDVNNDSLKDAINKLKARENSFRQLESISKLGSWEVDLSTNESTWSDQNYNIHGIEKNSFQPTIEYFFSMILPEYLQKAQATLNSAMKDGKVGSLECKLKRADGRVIDIILSGQIIYDDNNNPIKLIGTTQDITEFVTAQRDAKEFKNLIEYSSNEIYILDYNSLKYLYVNHGAIKSLGYTLEEFLEMDVYDVNPELTKEKVAQLKEYGKIHDKVFNRTIHERKDGTTYHAQSLIHTLQYQGKEAFVIFDADITQQVDNEQLLIEQANALNHQANHDALTSLPNRMLFQDRLSQTINSSHRNKEQFALLFIDLDQFKKINDSLGHHIGDKVLIECSSRLSSVLREEDTLARLGGDEFTIILKDVKGIQSASTVAQKIISIMREPIDIQGHTLFISSSIGISMYPQDASTEENLIKFADTAMYQAKDDGRDNFQFYSSDMTIQAFERVLMETSLRVAIQNEEFVVYFQPQYNALTQKINGMEALVRWNHPQLGLVPPGKFIPIAEESGLIVAIDRIVMKKAMEQFVLWYKDGLNPGVLALNLAMKQLNEKDFIYTLLDVMQSLDFQPTWLELEVTEGQVMDNPDIAIEKLKKISDIGIEIAIDDFGTGYSSLAYLKKLPLDKLKIDQGFIRDLPDDEEDIAITKAIIALGNSLNFKLIAEGVETKEQRDFLVENGCTNIQGYFYSKPIPAEEMTKLLEKEFN